VFHSRTNHPDYLVAVAQQYDRIRSMAMEGETVALVRHRLFRLGEDVFRSYNLAKFLDYVWFQNWSLTKA
jgi:hypothetical protein